MLDFLNALFGSNENALRRDLKGLGQQATTEAIRTVNASANRGAANPAALATAAAQAQAAQRAALVGQQAQLLGQARQQDQQRVGGYIGALGQTLAPLLISDERAKTDVRDGGSAVDAFLRSMHPATYEYRGAPGERQTGVMAQDVERTPVGKQLVTRDPASGMRAIEPTSAIGALLAAQARIAERLDAIERGRGKR